MQFLGGACGVWCVAYGACDGVCGVWLCVVLCGVCCVVVRVVVRVWCVCGVCVGCVMVLCTIKKFRQVQGINCIVKRLVGSRLTRIRSLATTNAEISASVLIFCAVAWRKQQGAIVLPFVAMTHSANK